MDRRKKISLNPRNRNSVSFVVVSILLGACTVTDAHAQQSMAAPTNGQVSTGPAPVNATAASSNSAPPAVTTPINTVGNTPSSVRTGSQSSGYSAGGNTSNTNINNTQVGNRGSGQPTGGGSNTTKPYGSR